MFANFGTDSTPRQAYDRLIVQSFGRLHFGLVEICEGQPNCFGGIGLMIEHSIAKLRCEFDSTVKHPEPQCDVLADEYWKSRVLTTTEHCQAACGLTPFRQVNLERAPEPHCGLGSGTQIACTVVAALLAGRSHAHQSHPTEQEADAGRLLLRLWEQEPAIGKLNTTSSLLDWIAQLSQRGKRSNIGLRGFLEGGFIFDRGRMSDPESIDIHRTQRVEFPSQWPILLIRYESTSGVSGDDESRMFELASSQANSNRDAMMRLIEEEIMPSLSERDWKSFGQSLGLYGRYAGQIFSDVQGGIYRTTQIARSIEIANALGLESSTQSSWGPTVCAIAKDSEHAIWCTQRLQTLLPEASICTVAAANRSAQIEWQ